MAIARLQLTALDSPDHRGLAAFYSAITGWPVRTFVLGRTVYCEGRVVGPAVGQEIRYDRRGG